MEAVVVAFDQEKALVRAFSVITNLLMELFQAALIYSDNVQVEAGAAVLLAWGGIVVVPQKVPSEGS